MKTKKGIFIQQVLTAIFATWAGMCCAQALPQRMQQVVQPYFDAGVFMGSVLVAQNGQVLLNKGYGFADLEWNIPNSGTTRFQIASVTKQFTAASILLLEDRGKLKTDDLVKKYLPDAPPSWDKMTIYDLLTMTSGIADDAVKYEPGPPTDVMLRGCPAARWSRSRRTSSLAWASLLRGFTWNLELRSAYSEN